VEINIFHPSGNHATIATILNKEKTWQQAAFTAHLLNQSVYTALVAELATRTLSGSFFMILLQHQQLQQAALGALQPTLVLLHLAG
jgi:hypothetical protein